MGEFGEFVLKFLTQATGHKGKGFHQTLHVRITLFLGQKVGQMWFFLRQQFAKLAKIIQLFAVVTFFKSPEGKAAETNYKLGTQLPYLFVISRLAHYIKVIQREQLTLQVTAFFP